MVFMTAIDSYTKVMLTVIAASLVWLCVSSGMAETPVQAQANQQRVIVAGWQDEKGFVHLLPAHTVGGSAAPAIGLPVRDVR
jgi:hypothetical protein